MSSTDAPAKPTEKNKCLVHAIAEALATEPHLEAITLNKELHPVALATLGHQPDPSVVDRLTHTVRHLQETDPDRRCGLLAGESECPACPQAFARYERQFISIQYEADRTTISKVSCPTAPRFWKWRDIPWPKLGPRQMELPDEDHEPLEEWKYQLAAAILCGGFGLLGAFTHYSLGFFLLSYLCGSWFPAGEVVELLGKRRLDVHFLMLAVAGGSALIGAWSEGATLLFLFSFSGALEHYAMGRTQREIRSLFKSAPKTALRLDAQGQEQEVPVETLQPGMRLLIKPDTQFPVDGEICRGTTAADESNLTGEAVPVEKAVGDTTLAGTLNLWGAVEVQVLRTARESALEKIIHLIREAQHLKAPSQRFTDKFGTAYTYGILGLSTVMFLVWWLGFGLPPFTASASQHSAFYRAMILLVVASPCALVLSIPSAVLAAIAWGARRGVLFRGGAAVEKLAEIDLVALDKTGTLTTGELKVQGVESFPPGRETEVLQLAYSLERLSSHPLARAISRHGKKLQLDPLTLEAFESSPGNGLQAKYKEDMVRLGRRSWLESLSGPLLLTNTPPVSGSEHSEVWLARNGLLGRILLRDELRPVARNVIARLQQAGLRTLVLTGDRRSAGEELQRALAVDEVRAELKPEEKVAFIRALTQEGRRVAMIGDGVNDAPSLAAAHVGVAMGARGSDAALEQAEVVLMHDRLELFWAALKLSKRARAIIRQNLVISLGTVVVLVGCALLGVIPLTLGVVGHEGSTVIVVLNSLRLLFEKDE